MTLQAAPPPPSALSMVNTPTGGFWLTNVTYVYTNTAVRTPTIDLAQVTVYGTNAIEKATLLAWAPPAALIGGYKLYYGMTGGGSTNTFFVNSNVTCVVFYSTLATNTTWWAYVTARDTGTNESVPSDSIVFLPK